MLSYYIPTLSAEGNFQSPYKYTYIHTVTLICFQKAVIATERKQLGIIHSQNFGCWGWYAVLV